MYSTGACVCALSARLERFTDERAETAFKTTSAGGSFDFDSVPFYSRADFSWAQTPHTCRAFQTDETLR